MLTETKNALEEPAAESLLTNLLDILQVKTGLTLLFIFVQFLPHLLRFFLYYPKNTITVEILISSLIYYSSRILIHFSSKKEQSNTKVPTKHWLYSVESRIKNG